MCSVLVMEIFVVKMERDYRKVVFVGVSVVREWFRD